MKNELVTELGKDMWARLIKAIEGKQTQNKEYHTKKLVMEFETGFIGEGQMIAGVRKLLKIPVAPDEA